MSATATEVLRRVGWTLIAVGVADTAYMIYCIATDRSYNSSVNLFAVLAGVFLVRGSLRAARYVSLFAGFMLAALGVSALLFPLVMPLDLLALQLRLNTTLELAGLVLAGAFLALLVWVYRSLTTGAVAEAQRAARTNWKPSRWPLVVGVALAIGLFGASIYFTNGGPAEIAKTKAREKLGPTYKYQVTNMTYSGQKGRATVTAYNDVEIREVEVDW